MWFKLHLRMRICILVIECCISQFEKRKRFSFTFAVSIKQGAELQFNPVRLVRLSRARAFLSIPVKSLELSRS
jgi:hypothetical protein